MKTVHTLLSLLICCLFSFTLAAQCPTFNLSVEVGACAAGDESFIATASIEPEGVSGDGYTVVGNGQTYFFSESYDELTFSVELPADGSTVYEFIIFDNAIGNDCVEEVTFGPVACPPIPCTFTSFDAEVVACPPEGGYDIHIPFFQIDNALHTYTVTVEGILIGDFSSSDFPLTLENVEVPTDALTFSIEICDESGCCVSIDVNNSCPPEEDDCIEFEETEREVYGNSVDDQPYSTVYTEDGTQMLLLPLQRLDWLTDFNDLLVVDAATVPMFPQASNNCLQYTGIATAFVFPADIPIQTMTMDFRYSSGTINLGFNGQAIQIWNDFPEGIHTFPSGITVEIIYDDSNGLSGTLTAEGPILSCLIGGQELFIDNICLNPEDICGIEYWNVGEIFCQDNGEYFVRFNIDIAAGVEQLSIQHHSSDIIDTIPANGDYAFNFPNPAGQNYFDSLIVCTLGPDACCETFYYDVPCEGPCPSIGLTATTECQAGGVYDLIIDYNFGIAENTALEIHIDDEVIGTFPAEAFPITASGYNNAPDDPHAITIFYALDDGDCSETYNAFPPFEPCEGCEISEGSVTEVACADTGVFEAYLNFDHSEGVSETFVVTHPASGESETFSYADLPVDIRFPSQTGLTDAVVVCDAEFSDCCQEIVFDNPCTTECVFQDIIVEAHPCENGEYMVDLALNVLNPGELGYYVFADGTINGPFSYDEPHVTLGPFPGDGSTVVDFLILDLDDPTCYGYTEFGPYDCNTGCGISNLEAVVMGCENNIYEIQIDLDYLLTDAPAVQVQIGDEVYGFYGIGDFPITVASSIQNGSLVSVSLSNLPDCVLQTEFLLPPCGAPCDIEISSVNFEGCDPVTEIYEFFVHLEAFNPNASTVLLEMDGDEIGIFPISDFPMLLTYDFTGYSDPSFLLTATVEENPDCVATYNGSFPSCGNTCIISNLSANIVSCDQAENTYEIEVNFDPINPDNDFFDLFINGELYEFYNLSDLPVTINYTATDGGQDNLLEIRTCINDNPDCCATLIMPLVCCDLDYLEIVNSTSCDNANEFDVDVAIMGAAGEPYTGSFVQGGVLLFEFSGVFNDTVSFTQLDCGTDLLYEVVITDQYGCEERVVFLPLDFLSPVWPGDVDLNFGVQHVDLLSIGVAYGATGTPRDQSDAGWAAQQSLRWDESFASGLGYQHADCDGNGIVDDEDVAILIDNFGLTHGTVIDPPEVPGTDFDPVITLGSAVGGPFTDQGSFMIPIILGEEDTPVEDIYGVAFTIEFDPGIFMTSDIEVEFPVSWFGEPGINEVGMYKLIAPGQLQVALTRTDQNNVSGFGVIGYIRGIIDDIAGYAPVEIKTVHPIAQNFLEEAIPLQDEVSYYEVITSTHETAVAQSVEVFPNPAAGIVNVRMTDNQAIEALSVLDLQGRKVIPTQYEVNQLNLQHLPEGIYTLQIQVDGQVIHKKLMKSR